MKGHHLQAVMKNIETSVFFRSVLVKAVTFLCVWQDCLCFHSTLTLSLFKYTLLAMSVLVCGYALLTCFCVENLSVTRLHKRDA